MFHFRRNGSIPRAEICHIIFNMLNRCRALVSASGGHTVMYLDSIISFMCFKGNKKNEIQALGFLYVWLYIKQ